MEVSSDWRLQAGSHGNSVSGAAFLDIEKHPQCILDYSSSREPPRCLVLDVHLEKLDVLQHGVLKFISGSLLEDRGVEEGYLMT